jgi:hypothetical protein
MKRKTGSGKKPIHAAVKREAESWGKGIDATLNPSSVVDPKEFVGAKRRVDIARPTLLTIIERYTL